MGCNQYWKDPFISVQHRVRITTRNPMKCPCLCQVHSCFFQNEIFVKTDKKIYCAAKVYVTPIYLHSFPFIFSYILTFSVTICNSNSHRGYVRIYYLYISLHLPTKCEWRHHAYHFTRLIWIEDFFIFSVSQQIFFCLIAQGWQNGEKIYSYQKTKAI